MTDQLEIVGEYTSLVNPGIDHLRNKCVDDRERLPFNDILLAEVLAARSKEVVAVEWREWMSKWSAEPSTHHAYNNAFDFRHLSLEPWGITSEMQGDCIMLAATKAADRIRWVKLVDSASRWGVSFTGIAHRALVDARAAAEVYVHILRARKAINV